MNNPVSVVTKTTSNDLTLWCKTEAEAGDLIFIPRNSVNKLPKDWWVIGIWDNKNYANLSIYGHLDKDNVCLLSISTSGFNIDADDLSALKDFVLKAKDNGAKVAIHCTEGIIRSPFVAYGIQYALRDYFNIKLNYPDKNPSYSPDNKLTRTIVKYLED